MKKITAILLASVTVFLVGCNTVSGFGKDVQKVGEKVEDSAENLRSAKRLGMKTVWISRSLRQPAYVDVRLPSVLDLARHPVRRGASG